VQKPKHDAFVDARGRVLVERRGLSRELGSRLANDAYHFLRTTTWTRITLLFALLFLALNLGFGALFYASNAVTNADGYLDCCFFSVQTIATIGYGGMTPTSTFANSLVAIESFVGIGFTALATGVMFSRFATPSARVMFSRVAVIGESEGQRALLFRMANARSTAIVEATVRLYVSLDSVTSQGEYVRRIHDLELRRDVTPIFALSWTAVHVIDEASPLHGVELRELPPGAMNFIVTFQGIDDRLASTVHTRWTYNSEDLVFGHRFVDILKRDPSGVRYLDFTHFHDTEPVATP